MEWGSAYGSRKHINQDVNAIFIKERTRLHELYIREEAKTKRLTLIIALLLFLAGCSVILFAPSGRELLFNWIGAAMLIIAAGSAGYKGIWGKSKILELKADQHESGADRESRSPQLENLSCAPWLRV